MQIQILEKDGEVPRKFIVSGLPIHTCVFEYEGRDWSLDLTLNGTYNRTPGGHYSMISDSEQHRPAAPPLSFHVILVKRPVHAEFQVFRFHERSDILEEDLPKLNISREVFDLVSLKYPESILRALEAEQLPIGVSKFLMQARKCTSN